MAPFLRLLASRRSALALLAMAAGLMLYGASSPEAFASGVWNFKLLGGVLALLGLALSVHLARTFRRQILSPRAGGWLLHAGLLAVLAGGGWNYFAARAKTVEVIEGQEVAVVESSRLRLDRFKAFLKQGRQFRGAAAEVTVLEGGRERRQLIHVNRPGAAEGAEILLGRHGFAPLVRVEDGQGRSLLYAYFSLQTEFGGGRHELPEYARILPLPGRGDFLRLSLRPAPSGGLPTEPRLSVTAADGAGRSLSLGESVSVGGLRVGFEDLRYWADFDVHHDPGVPLVFVGLALALLGSGLAFRHSLGDW